MFPQPVTAMRYSTSKAFNIRRVSFITFSTVPLVQDEFAAENRRSTSRTVVILASRWRLKWVAVSLTRTDGTPSGLHQPCNAAAAFAALAAEAGSNITKPAMSSCMTNINLVSSSTGRVCSRHGFPPIPRVPCLSSLRRPSTVFLALVCV